MYCFLQLWIAWFILSSLLCSSFNVLLYAYRFGCHYFSDTDLQKGIWERSTTNKISDKAVPKSMQFYFTFFPLLTIAETLYSISGYFISNAYILFVKRKIWRKNGTKDISASVKTCMWVRVAWMPFISLTSLPCSNKTSFYRNDH